MSSLLLAAAQSLKAPQQMEIDRSAGFAEADGARFGDVANTRRSYALTPDELFAFLLVGR